MVNNSNWLPPLVLFEDYNGNWERYLNVIYDFFKQDFVDSKPVYSGKKLALKKHHIINGKEATFWHIIQQGEIEDERIPDFRRCERIRWPKPIIEEGYLKKLKIWKNKRKNENRICIWNEDEEYLVVLAERKGFILLWTAYLVLRKHQKAKLRKEYKKANAAS